MRTRFFLIASVVISLCACSRERSMVLDNISLSEIHPEGWLRTMLENQRNGLTGYLDTIGFPFMSPGMGWGEDKPFINRDKVTGKQYVNWIPYEQTGYYFDGVMRCGLLLGDSFLTEKARRPIYGSIERASDAGVIEARLSEGENRRWPHAVFFRSWMALYEATGDPALLEAMESHFAGDTVTLYKRDLCNIESMWWLYTKTGRKDIREKILSLRGQDGLDGFIEEELGDYASEDKQEVHGVTYDEFLKIPVIYYLMTGDKKELERARNGFYKIDRYHMLPDGVNSSEEGLSGQGPLNVHELCDVVDYTWSCSYMLRATAETQWADRMERAVFNAGLGSITKDFKSHQYYSAPNQIYCEDYSCNVTGYALGRMAYRQLHRPPCCTGNVNRMLPVLVGNQWLRGRHDALYKAIYGPGSVTHRVGDKNVVLEEDSVYPYCDTVNIRVRSGAAAFALYLRIPAWAEAPEVILNGEECSGVQTGSFYRIKKRFTEGDEIQVILPKAPKFVKCDGGDAMTVSYGPMLFALPVEANSEWREFRLKGADKPFFAYTKSAASEWNYALGVDGTDNRLISVVTRPMSEADKANPWAAQPQPIQLRVPVYKDPTWWERYQKVLTEKGETLYAPMTPPLPPRGSMIYVLRTREPEVKALVPYGSCELRISMFPYWKQREIGSEILAADD